MNGDRTPRQSAPSSHPSDADVSSNAKTEYQSVFCETVADTLSHHGLSAQNMSPTAAQILANGCMSGELTEAPDHFIIDGLRYNRDTGIDELKIAMYKAIGYLMRCCDTIDEIKGRWEVYLRNLRRRWEMVAAEIETEYAGLVMILIVFEMLLKDVVELRERTKDAIARDQEGQGE